MKKLLFPIIALLAIACSPRQPAEEKSLPPDPADFDTLIDGKSVNLFVLENANGIKVCLTNYGARVVSVITPDNDSNFADIALGYNSIQEYLKDNIYSGPIAGRFANRIKEAKFTLDGKEYNLFKNDGNNTLHGGKKGLDKKIWDAVQEGNSVTMSYLSPDGEEGYPGNLSLTKTYTLTADNELKMEMSATTDAPTVINLCNHAAWNLKGEGDSTILDHYFEIYADAFTPIDKEWIPTGEIAPVEGTPLDFRKGKQIGQDIDAAHEQLINGLGYDHNWVLNKDSAGVLSLAAKLWEQSTGRMIEIYTNEPGMQFYSGNFLNGSVVGKSGRPYPYRSALVFETQHFPDSPNHENFPTTVLRPGEKYYHLVVCKFGLVK